MKVRTRSTLFLTALLLSLLAIGGMAGSTPVAAQSGNIVINGSFESPVVPSTVTELYHTAGQTFGNWTVESGSVDQVRVWQAASGIQCIDMSGTSAGTIYQDLATVPGQTYRLSFHMAGNPAGAGGTKRMEVWWGSTLVDTPSFDTGGKTHENMGWIPVEYVVEATTSTTRLKFVSLYYIYEGAALDNVSVAICPRIFTGHVYEGASGSTTPSGGGEVRLYGSSSMSHVGVHLNTSIANPSTGAYRLETDKLYAYYHVYNFHTDYDPTGAQSASGGVVRSPRWIAFAAPPGDSTMAGNDFWENPPEQPSTPTPTATLATNIPDLVIASAQSKMKGYAGGCITETLPLVLEICSKNEGDVDAGAFSVIAGGCLTGISEWRVDGLPVGESICLESEERPMWWSQCEIVVDPYQEVPEADEDNNTLSAVLPIPTAPPYCAATATPTATATEASTATPTMTATSTPTPSGTPIPYAVQLPLIQK